MPDLSLLFPVLVKSDEARKTDCTRQTDVSLQLVEPTCSAVYKISKLIKCTLGSRSPQSASISIITQVSCCEEAKKARLISEENIENSIL